MSDIYRTLPYVLVGALSLARWTFLILRIRDAFGQGGDR